MRGKTRGIAQRHWLPVPPQTVPPGYWGNCGHMRWGACGWGKERFCRGIWLSSRRMGRIHHLCWVQSPRSWLAGDLHWLPPTATPVHKRLAKSGEGACLQCYTSP